MKTPDLEPGPSSTETAEVARLARQAMNLDFRSFGRHDIAPVGEGTRLVTVRAAGIEQAVGFSDLDSFVAYVRDFKQPETVMFLDVARGGRLSVAAHAVIDYHRPGSGDQGAGHSDCHHRAIFEPTADPDSAPWEAFAGAYRKLPELAEFLQANPELVREPDVASLLELAAEFRVQRSVEQTDVRDLRTGGVRFQFAEHVRGQSVVGGAVVEAPAFVRIAWRPYARNFFGGDANAILLDLQFRYRADASGVQVGLFPKTPFDVLRRRAFAVDLRDACAELAVPMYVARPEPTAPTIRVLGMPEGAP